MRDTRWYALAVLIASLWSGSALAADEGPIAWWKFDEVKVERHRVEMVRGETFVPREVLSYVRESVSNSRYELHGAYHKVVPGVRGKAVLLDGYTTYIEAPPLEDLWGPGAISVEAWIALGAYPKHWSPIVDQQLDQRQGYFNGYFFGVDAMGRLLFRIASTSGKYEELLSTATLPLNEWLHVAGVYTQEEGMQIYVNGELAGTLQPADEYGAATNYHGEIPLLIGKSRGKHKPFGTIRPYGTAEAFTFLDAILDEIKIYGRGLSAREIAATYAELKPTEIPGLPVRILPSGPPGTGRFGAINKTLKYYPAWDAPWHVGDMADVVVRFDETPCRFVFWRGTNYIPNWVTENGIWFNNAFDEGWNEHGSCEPMSDKRTLHQFVKILESNDARVVVQWRYGLVDVYGQFAFVDPATQWGDWSEETYTIYPDMVGVRENKMLTAAPNAAHEPQESIMVMGPGQRPEDVLEFAALSLANMDGKTHTYSWEHKTPPFRPDDPKNANILTINTKSEYHPFSAIRPQDKPDIDVYAGEIRRDVSVFPWWNHWPVAPRPTDGRYAMHSDRASHASLSHWQWDSYETTDNSTTKILLHGLTTKSVGELVPLVNSWSNPAELRISDKEFVVEGYDPTELAYQLTCTAPGTSAGLSMELRAKKDSPVVNPAFVIKNWGFRDVELELNGESIARGKNFRFGFRDTLEGTDLIVWIRTESTRSVRIVLSPV
jgi:hypothetical protein